ncbi:hypothetical protein BIW11_01759 [Tropilaelaps mercedesae]|uniref:Histidine-rich glycoprotein-like n=1 Tax=Tropilaelaps mercedesae TaxID=418985 RepID=A0A1V9X8R0_9ACAR|nr:hypothetical protein BIW11_01759 [Tropilaelaps mercedesae]
MMDTFAGFLGIIVIAILAEISLAGDLHGAIEADHGYEDYGDDVHGYGDHHHEGTLGHIVKVTHVKTPTITHHVKKPVVSYITKSVKKVSFAKQPVYSISYKPIVISHGYSYHTSKYGGLHNKWQHGHYHHQDWHHHTGDYHDDYHGYHHY